MSWHARIPFSVRVFLALALGVAAGELMGSRAAVFQPIGDLVLQLLRLLATPLIFIAVVHALMKTEVRGYTGARLLSLLLTNTATAILFGLLVANVVQPGRWVHLTPTTTSVTASAFHPLQDLLGKVPANLVDPFAHNEILSVIILALAVGTALRIVRLRQQAEGAGGYRVVWDFLETAFQAVMVMLRWVFALVPLAIFTVIAKTVGTAGIRPLLSMGFFVAAVVLGLALQAIFYLTRLHFASWVSPVRFLRGATDALVMAFSTASSAATQPVTYTGVKDRIGVREESASLGVMVGGTFSHDGAALYESMAALFIAQAMGLHLDLGRQMVVVLMSMLAAFGAAGIPSAGLVTMLAVFSAVHLPVEYVPLLLPLDWLLDRCRTAVNVMGDMAVACLLDGRQPSTD